MSSGQSPAREYQLCIVGVDGVGKSALIFQFVLSRFVDTYDPMQGEPYRKQCTVDTEVVLVDLLDTDGPEDRSRAAHTYWLERSEAFLLVYSVANRQSFDYATTLHAQILRVKGVQAVPLVLVGNKCDLSDVQREVTADEGRRLAGLFGCRFLETSAKEGTNVQEVFLELLRVTREHNRV
ncbi:ras-like protein 2 [Gloeopeniophorella convolvens]|nr:ras-like protein 2 [Gloeopeniophorella convolvens]